MGITEGLEYLLEEVLSLIPCRKRCREKGASRQEVILAGASVGGTTAQSATQGSDLFHEDVGHATIIEKRTFLCFAPALYQANSVVQSTTEATVDQSETHYAYCRGRNPRRFA